MSSANSCYIASPLFSAAEKEFNQVLATAIEENMRVFLPQRDGALLTELLGKGVHPDAAGRQIAADDLRAIRTSSAVVAVLDGQTIDEGVAFEVGFAHALGIPCIGLITDPRRTTLGFVNPMVSFARHATVTSKDELLDILHAVCAR